MWRRAVERASIVMEVGTWPEKLSALTEAVKQYEPYPSFVNAHVARYRLRLAQAQAAGQTCPPPASPTELHYGTPRDYDRMVTRLQAIAGCVPCEAALAQGLGATDSTASVVDYARCALRMERPELAITALEPYATFNVDFLQDRIEELPTFHTHLARYWLARAHDAAGHREQAISWYRRFAALLDGADRPLPQFVEAHAALARLGAAEAPPSPGPPEAGSPAP